MSIQWENSAAIDELAFLIMLFGQPSAIEMRAGGLAIWNQEALSQHKLFGNSNCFVEYVLKDESIAHAMPVPHYDNQSGSVYVDIPPQALDYVTSLSGSISYDPLKRLLSARCGDIAAVIATLYLAVRIVENPARTRNIQNQGLYKNLITELYKPGGVRGWDLPLVERVYIGLCRMLKELPQTEETGYWRGAFDANGGPPTENGKYRGDARNAAYGDFVQRQRANALKRRHNGNSSDNNRDDHDNNSNNNNNNNNNRRSADISLGLENAYRQAHNRDVTITSVEPLIIRPHRPKKHENIVSQSDISLDLAEEYQRAHDRQIYISNVEPFSSRSDSMDHESLSVSRDDDMSRFEQMTNQTDNWMQRIAESETEDARNRSGYNRSNSREYFCGRRQYNPDIPSCAVQNRSQFKPNCDPCNDYVHVYHTGLHPESTEPICFYGRRSDAYIDAAAYMRHYEEHAHDPTYYQNFY